jgi:hypothetical protein
MDATPALMWSTQRLVSEDFAARAVPRDRRGSTASAFFHADASTRDHPDPDATRSAWVVR